MIEIIIASLIASFLTANDRDYKERIERQARECNASYYHVRGFYPIVSSRIDCTHKTKK